MRPVRILILILMVLFQSHWLDDVGSGASDAAGIAVSAIGTLALGAGLATRHHLGGRILLALALILVAFISVADLVGLQPDGSRTADLVDHWTTGLGEGMTAAVALTLVCAIAALMRLISGGTRSAGALPD